MGGLNKKEENKKRFQHLLELINFLFEQFQISQNQRLAAEAAQIELAAQSEENAEQTPDEDKSQQTADENIQAEEGNPYDLNPEQEYLDALNKGLEAAYDKMAGAINNAVASGAISGKHAAAYKQNMKQAFCVGNPVELLRKMQQTRQLVRSMANVSDKECDSMIEAHLVARGGMPEEFRSAMRPQFRQAVKDHGKLDENQYNESHTQVMITSLFMLTAHDGFYQSAAQTASTYSGGDRVSYVRGASYTGNNILSTASIQNFLNQAVGAGYSLPRMLNSGHSNNWATLFNNNPYSMALRPGMGAGGGNYHNEEDFTHRI